MFNPWSLLRKRPVAAVTAAPAPDAPAGAPRPARRVRGQAIPLIALMMIALIGFTGLAVDVSFLILRTLQQQRAADAAALAGVIKLPDNPSVALSRAREYAEKNGYPHHPGGAAYPDVQARQVPGYNTRIHVTIAARHEVYFMRIFGISDVLVTRDSEAVYALPVRLGSPDPYFGVGNLTAVAAANNLPPDPLNGGSCPNCGITGPQNFSASIDGPSSRYVDGDPYNTLYLDGFTNSCPGGINTTPNDRHSDRGYNYRVALDSSLPGQPIDVYVYDPAQYYRSGIGPNSTDADTNDQQPCRNFGTPPQNRYRYSTTFTLYYPDATPDYFGDDLPVPGGTRTFTDNGINTNLHDKWFRIGSVEYDPQRDANANFRLQVTTTGNNDGVGRNQYSLALGGPRLPTNVEQIYGITSMSIFNNIRNVPTGQTIEWYLAKVPGEHAGERMSVRMFDPGDSTCATFMQLWQLGATAPTDFDLNWSGNIINTLQTTDASGRNLYDGQWVTLGVTLPPAGQYFDTWWKVRYIIGAGCRGTSTDRTVWEILMLGSPIHNVPPP